MSTGRVTGENNEAGALVPQKSVWGQLLAAATGRLIDQPPPIGHQTSEGFGGTVGGIVTRSASVHVLQSDLEESYYGDIPQDEQPLVGAVQPWNRP